MISSRTQVEPLGVVELQPMRRQLRSIALHAVTGALAYKLIGLLAPAVFITAGLRNGKRGLIGALAGAAGILALFSAMLPSSLRALELSDTIRLVLEVGLASAVALVLLRRRVASGTVVVAAVIASGVGFALTELVLRQVTHLSLYAVVLEELRARSSELLQTVKQNPAAARESLEMLKHVTAAIIDRFVPSLLFCTWAASFAASLTLLPRVAYDLSGSEEYLFRRFALPDWLLLLFVASGLSPLLREPFATIGYNMLAVVLFLFVLQGLSIYRSVLARLPIGLFGLIVAFALLFLLMQAVLPLVLLALAGLFDPFFDFRHLHRKEQNNESDSD